MCNVLQGGLMKSIVVIGSINIDLFVTTNQVPQVGETLHGIDFNLFHGGKGANQAVAAARLGAPVSFIGAVGDDENGRLAINSLNVESIDTSCVEVISGIATGVANVISCQGDNSIIVVEGANGCVNSEFVSAHESKIRGSDIVLLQNEIPFSGVKKAIEIANKYNKIIIYNPAPFTSETNEVSELVTYCTPNEIESVDINYKQNLIVTLGEKGVRFKELVYPANKVKVVDTTGAGDTFNGALCASLAKGNSIVDSIQYGVNASGLAIQKVGAQTGMPYEKEIL